MQSDIRRYFIIGVVIAGLGALGCQKKAAPPAQGGGMQGMPVQTAVVASAPVPDTSEYVATIKSRRSATIQPQVSGTLTTILVQSGDRVKAGQPLMEIDRRQQQATVASQTATERQKKALFDYHSLQLERQKKLFDAGITSRDVMQQEEQAFQNSKADYEASGETLKASQQLLDYYTVRAASDGVIGDIPVHQGDYVSQTTALTTLDSGSDLEAYIYIPAERSADIRMGLGIDLADNDGKVLDRTSINFVSPQVDSSLQAILVKAPVHSASEALRNAQLVKARVTWTIKPMPVVPVLAVVRQGAQAFVFVARKQGPMTLAQQVPVTLGDTVGNMYSIRSGLNVGDKVIVSATQFLVNNMPVIPMGG